MRHYITAVIYVLIHLYAVPCINAGEVWVVTKKPAKVWVITNYPEIPDSSPVKKKCGCSNACSCGCNEGKPCDCNKRSTPYRIVSPSEAWSCTVGNG